MNERFLFRGKRKDNGAWETGFLVIKRWDCSDERYFITDKMTGWHTTVIPETIGQCTGLEDKNGKLIFEGDIVNFVNDDGESSLYVVVWNTSLLSWQVQEISHYVKNDYYGFDELCEFGDPEVTGNVYDNLELLEAER